MKFSAGFYVYTSREPPKALFAAFSRQTPAPRDTEVMDYQWVKPDDLLSSVRATPWAFSPWMVLQLGQVTEKKLSLLG